MREVVLSPGKTGDMGDTGNHRRGARFRSARFWIVTLAALALVALTLSLGRWQLARAAHKEALAARIEAQQQRPALDLAGLQAIARIEGGIDHEMHRPVRLRGLWLPAHTVYLDNRQMHGRPGFFVLTPFALEGAPQTLMVQRGWVPRDFMERTRLPPVQTPAGLVEIEARIAPPPARLLGLGREGPDGPMPAPARDAAGNAVAAPGPSRIRQNLNLDTFRAETGLPLRTDFSLQQTGAASEGLDRQWPAPTLGIDRHYGYAFQWFALAVLLILLYVWFQFIAPRRRG